MSALALTLLVAPSWIPGQPGVAAAEETVTLAARSIPADSAESKAQAASEALSEDFAVLGPEPPMPTPGAEQENRADDNTLGEVVQPEDVAGLLRGSVRPAELDPAGRTAALHDMLHRTVIHDRKYREGPVTDMALRHTDKGFFSSNPVSFMRPPPDFGGDLDAQHISPTALSYGPNDVPYDTLLAVVDISEQRMRVYEYGVLKHTWKVSTGRRGYSTPTGQWRPYRMHTMWHSRKYNMAPMPHAVFYHGGYAVHATGAVGRLGRPASHGCVRLHPTNARKFFRLVSEHKRAGTKIRVVR